MKIKNSLPPFVLFVSFVVSGCSSLPAEFWSKDRDFSTYGLYNVSQLGLTGFGALNYTSKKVDDDKIAALQEQIETLTKVVYAIVAKLSEAIKGSNSSSRSSSSTRLEQSAAVERLERLERAEPEAR